MSQAREAVVEALASALPSGRGVVLHADIGPIGLLGAATARAGVVAEHGEAVLEAVGHRPLAVPTFNYDCLSTGAYHVAHDPCQVGALNEWFRQRPGTRTRTPVFNFHIENWEPHASIRDPFGKGSLFDAACRDRLTVALYGARLRYNTLLHHVEELAEIEYRYVKRFRVAICDRRQEEVEFLYRVRPRFPEAAQYDWPRIESESVNAGVLARHRVGRGTLLTLSAAQWTNYWLGRLDEDWGALLTPQGRRAAETLWDRHGRPLEYTGDDPLS